MFCDQSCHHVQSYLGGEDRAQKRLWTEVGGRDWLAASARSRSTVMVATLIVRN
jgi:hypothetical protein